MLNCRNEGKSSEDDGQQCESAMHSVFNSISEPVFIIDSEGKIIEANKAFALIFGKEVHECINANVYNLLPPKLAIPRKEKADEAFRTKTQIIFEDERDGLFILHTINPIADKDGTIFRLYIISRDITELKLAEQNSLNQTIFSREIIEAIPGAFYMLDAGGRYVQWNAYQRDVVVGKSDSEMVNTFALDTVHPDDKALIAEKKLNIMNRNVEDSEEVRILIHGGPEFRWFRISGKKIIVNGEQFLFGIGSDITDRKKAEEAALKNSEDRFKQLFEGHSSVMLVIDKSGNIIDANPAAALFYGWSIDELKMMHAGQVSMSSMKCVMDDLNKIRKSELDSFARKHKRADGSIRDVEITIKMILIDGKEIFYAIINDITERKEIEEALRKSERNFRNITEQMSEVVMVVDTAGILTYVSPVVEKMFGYLPEELIGYPFTQYLPEEGIPDALAIFNNIVLHNVTDEVFEFSFRNKNGSPVYGEVHVHVYHDQELHGIIGLIHDITERKQTEMQLKKLGTAVEQSPAIVVITDPLGNIEFVNPMFTLVTGYSAEEVLGQNPRILKSGLMPEALYEDLWRTILSGDVWSGELQNRKKNGELYWDQAVISAIVNKEGMITNFVAVKLDITEQKQILSELIASKERAEESDRLKSAFLANISHEIRTPMNGILGFAQLLKEPQLSGTEQGEYIDMIQQSGERMLNLINNLINISRIEAGETLLHIAKTSVNELLRDLYTFFKHEMDKKGLRLHCMQSLSDSESIIETDSGKLVQILTNLIQNALKFTRKGEIDFGYNLINGFLEFYVIDTGIGIALDMKEKIFDRFHQVDNPLTRTEEGAGLGLSISKAYVEMLGGTIRVESGEEWGSVFYFTLPYRHHGSTIIPLPPPVIQMPVITVQTLTILVVEDDAVSNLLLKMYLNKGDITTLLAFNGKEAVGLVDHHPEINLVLMDLKMPVMDGYEATVLIKKIRPDLTIIAQSAFTSKEEKQKAIEAGCDGFISKPIDKNELFTLITDLFLR